MNLVKRPITKTTISNLTPADMLRKQINSIFEDAFSGFGIMSPFGPDLDNYGYSCDWCPSVEAFEDENKYSIKAALPGISKENIDINVEETMITISGQHSYHNEVKEENLYKNELQYGKFSRSFSLAKPIDVENVVAEFKDGLLVLQLPKKEPEKKKSISIKL